MTSSSPRGRHREAAENDVRIFDAAHAVFTLNPDAPIAVVGSVAGVGKSALYRRYASKDELLKAVAEKATEKYVSLIALAHRRLDDSADPRWVLQAFLADALDTGTHALMTAISGRFEPTPRDRQLSAEGWVAGDRLVARFQDAATIGPDIGWLDLNKLLEGLSGIRSTQPDRTPEIRLRFAAILAAGLSAADTPLPGAAVETIDFGPRSMLI